MKKYASLIALSVVIILAIVVVTTKKEPIEKVRAPHSIAHVEELERIELTQPGEDGGLVVLTQGSEGWTLTKPVEAPLADRVSEQVAQGLGKKISTDDIKLDATDLSQFGLDDDNATTVALFAKGSQSPAAEFVIGNAMTVEGTRAKRTYIKTTDGKVYRAQTDLGEVLGKPVDELRSKTVQKLDRKAVSEIKVIYQDESKNLRLTRDKDDWKLAEPAVDFTLERSATSGLLNGVSNLIATGFVVDRSPADVGLDPWNVKVAARETGGDVRSILISEVQGDKAYVKTETSPHIYEIAKNTAEQLTASPLTLRNRLVKDIKAEDVKFVQFGGADRIAVERTDAGWVFAGRTKGQVKESALTPKLNAIAQLRAVRFETPELGETGLQRPVEQVTLTTKDGGRHVLLIGTEADEKGNLWAKWEDVDLIMVVPQWIKERAAPTAAELTDESS